MDTPLQCGALLHASGNPSALSLDFHRLHPAHPAWMAMELPWPPWVETALFDPVLLSGFGLLTLEPLGLLTHLPGVTSAFQGSPQLFFSHSFASGKTGLDFLPLLTHYLTPLLSDCYLITPGLLSESPWLAPLRCLLSLPPPPFWCVMWADSVSLASTPLCLFLWCDLSLPHVAPAARSRSPPLHLR